MVNRIATAVAKLLRQFQEEDRLLQIEFESHMALISGVF